MNESGQRYDHPDRSDYEVVVRDIEDMPVVSFTSCRRCGCLVFDEDVHDGFHDSYKPPRKASFIVENPDHSFHVQFIDGSTCDLQAVDIIDEDHAVEIWDNLKELLNGTNAALAPFYEGGETSAVTHDLYRTDQ